MVGVQMGEQHMIHVFGLDAERGKSFEERSLQMVEHGAERALLGIAEAGIDENDLAAQFNDPGVDAQDDVLTAFVEPGAKLRLLGEDSGVPLAVKVGRADAGQPDVGDASDARIADAVGSYGLFHALIPMKGLESSCAVLLQKVRMPSNADF